MCTVRCGHDDEGLVVNCCNYVRMVVVNCWDYAGVLLENSWDYYMMLPYFYQDVAGKLLGIN